MKDLLFLVHRIPYPPNKGDKIRSFNLLRHLSANHNVYLGGFVDEVDDWQFVPELEKYCSDIFLQPIKPMHSRLSAAKALLTGRSLSVGYYANSKLQDWVESVVRDNQIATVVAFSSTMAQFLPDGLTEETAIVADFVDLDSDKWHQYAAESRWPLSLVYEYESRALARWESDILQKVDAVTLVSEEECRLAREQYGPQARNVQVIRNGVDAEFFDPDVRSDSPYPSVGPVVLFTGAMDYFANVQGVRWFAEHIWPDVRSNCPTAEFWIVGSKPTKEIRDLASIEGIEVTGFVADVRPYLSHARVAVAPLMLARGVQNKVLEALAMGLPVVATPQALQGLDGSLPDSITSASGVAEFSNAIMQSLGVKKTAGDGRGYVLQNYDWARNLSEIDRILARKLESAPSNSGIALPNP